MKKKGKGVKDTQLFLGNMEGKKCKVGRGDTV